MLGETGTFVVDWFVRDESLIRQLIKENFNIPVAYLPNFILKLEKTDETKDVLIDFLSKKGAESNSDVSALISTIDGDATIRTLATEIGKDVEWVFFGNPDAEVDVSNSAFFMSPTMELLSVYKEARRGIEPTNSIDEMFAAFETELREGHWLIGQIPTKRRKLSRGDKDQSNDDESLNVITKVGSVRCCKPNCNAIAVRASMCEDCYLESGNSEGIAKENNSDNNSIALESGKEDDSALSTPKPLNKQKGIPKCHVEDCASKVVARGVCIKHGAKGNCQMDECNTFAIQKGLCVKHGAHGVCKVPGCGGAVIRKGVCTIHGGKYMCKVEGCLSSVKGRGLCTAHGGKGVCKIEGCNSNVQVRGLCVKHGATGKCKVEGCQSNVVARGLCWRHGGTGICKIAGCNAPVVARGLCRVHDRQNRMTENGEGPVIRKGFSRRCKVSGCTTPVVGRGLCFRHGGKGICKFEGCGSNAQIKGFCKIHGVQKLCSVEGCTSKAVGRGLCIKHGGKGKCKIAGCMSNAYVHGLCTKHGARGKCKVEGCNSNVQTKGLCFKHGEKRTCKEEGCPIKVVGRTLCHKHGKKRLITDVEV